MSLLMMGGGIADGKEFTCARAPVYLRVVHGPENKAENDYFDVLDLLEDEPFPSDTIYVYRQTSVAFICGRGRGAHSGRHAFYKPDEDFKADQAELHDTDTWRALVDKVSRERGEI